jgi:hypothetical protein
MAEQLGSAQRESCVLPDPGRVNAEDDILKRGARDDQLLSDRLRRAIVLNPHLAVFLAGTGGSRG